MKLIYIIISIMIVLSLVSFILYFIGRESETNSILNSKLDEKFCDGIEFEPLKNVCQIAFSKDIDSCKNVERGYDIKCYEIAVEAMDVSESICENMRSNYVKFLCNKKLAIKLKDPELCGGNINCYIELASINEDESICENIEFDQEKYKCLAKVIKNRDYCNNIEDEIERMNCIGAVPEEVSDCKIESYNYINFDCLSELAYKEKNSTICDLISLEELKWTCIINVENDLKACDNAPDFFKDLCKIDYLKNCLKD